MAGTTAPQTASPQRADPQRVATHRTPERSHAPRSSVARLQRTAGNQSVLRLLQARAIQPKLTVGPADDEYEREADRVADEIVRMPDPGPLTAQRASPRLQRLCPECEEEKKEEEEGAGAGVQRAPAIVQRLCAECEEEEAQRTPVQAVQRMCPACAEEEAQRTPDPIQRMCPECEEEAHRQPDDTAIQRALIPLEDDNEEEEEDGGTGAGGGMIQTKRAADDSPEPSAELDAYVQNSRDGGQPLPESTRASFESRFGQDFGGVRVHTGTRAAEAAGEINALAFTTGSNIYFAAGRFNPGTPDGDRLLAHELTHTIQQTGGRPLERDIDPAQTAAHGAAESSTESSRGGDIARTARSDIQRFPSPGEVLDVLEDTVSEAAEIGESAIDTAGGAISDAADTIGDAVDDAADAVGEAADAVVDTAGDVAGAIGDAGGAVIDAAGDALDWLETEAGQLALTIADALDGIISITPDGLLITVPEVCPVPALTYPFDLPSIDKELMAPVIVVPIGPVILMGSLGVAGHLQPHVELQLGPICLQALRILLNPLTGTFSISGGLSATAAVGLAAEIRGGVRGALSLEGVVPIGGVPVPVSIDLAAVEGGLAGLVRGIGAATLKIGSGLRIGSGGLISLNQTRQLDIGLAADLFAGAYGQVDLRGEDICRIYWQPYEWHGDMAASLGISMGVSILPGRVPTIIPTITPPTIARIPFNQIPLALTRKGFSDDCPIIDTVCKVLKDLSLLPSQNGGVWNWSGPYGPGPRLTGPLDVYQANPGIPSGALCRGACGIDCVPCEHIPRFLYVDPITGDVWEYLNFEDCSTNEGCRQHDAAFDWAADVHGEIGRGAMFMPWHMAANVECTCENLAGNCVAWAIGYPPYDGTIFFATGSRVVSHGGGPTGSGSCHDDYPGAPECLASYPDRDTVLDQWGQQHGIENFRDCKVSESYTNASVIDCDGGPGNYWICLATDTVTGEEVTVGLFECICCNDDDTSSSQWMTPNIVVTPDMSEELILELCDRGLIPRVICIPFEEDMLARFGNRRRDINLDPDKDPVARLRPDDAPILDSFRRIYNRLESWNIFLKVNHPEIYPEFKSRFDIDASREAWLKSLKERTAQFKQEFRDLGNTDPQQAREDYERFVLGTVQKEVEDKNREIAEWYKDKVGSGEPIDAIIEDVHRQGTELWRAAWRRAILQVNRVLSRLWPPAKRQILFWVGDQRRRHPGVDLDGPVGEIDYIGSLATGYKGPPKQLIRFNPEQFDVDANLAAPPLAKYAVQIDGLIPDRGRIFASKTSITPLKDFSTETHAEMSARVEGYNKEDPFDVVIDTPELPVQERERKATERLYELREKLTPDKYEEMRDELRRGGFLTPDGTKVRDNLTESEYNAMNEIMDRYDPGPRPTRTT